MGGVGRGAGRGGRLRAYYQLFMPLSELFGASVNYFFPSVNYFTPP